MNELMKAIRKAVRAEIEAATGAAAPVSCARNPVALAEQMEVARCWGQAARVGEMIMDDIKLANARIADAPVARRSAGR